MGFNLRSGLNAGESPVSFPDTPTELERAGLCQHCLDYVPVPRPDWTTLTDEEIEDALQGVQS